MLGERTSPPRQQQQDCGVSIFYREREGPCGVRGSVRVLASVQGLPPARAQKNIDALDLSRDISNRSWKGHDPLSDLRDAVVAARSLTIGGLPVKGGCPASS